MMSIECRGRLAARLMGAGAALAAGLLAAAGPAMAQDAAPPPSESLAVNLVRLLVKQGVISQENADAIMKQAEEDTAKAKAAAPVATAQSELPPPAPGSVRVAYVPEIVKNQIRDEVRQEVMTQARSEGWAAPNLVPEWVNRITWSGDLRVRDEFDLYGDGNTNEFVDFATFNANGPTDINDITNPNGLPFLNTRKDRNNNLKYRARLGLIADVTDGVTVGVRLASGQNNGPISTNDLLGGGFTKKDVWIDRAYVTLKPTPYLEATFGRAPNPFVSTDLVYDEDLNFDGASARAQAAFLDDGALKLSLTGGAFPLEYSSANFPTNSTFKNDTISKWLFGGQLAVDYKPWADHRILLAGAYYDFHNVRGQISQPCALYNGNKQCSSDPTRPAVMGKGNTLFLLRNILPDPANPLNFAQPQFVGLSFDYNLLDLNFEYDWRFWGTRQLVLQADYVRNLAYKASDVCRLTPLGHPVNNVLPSAAQNFDPCSTPPPGDAKAVFQSGPDGWMVRATIGDPKTRKWGDWNVSAGYRYLQPDAVLDAFTDSDFHLGGTNAKGYFVSGSLGLFKNTWLTARWMSADEVYGPPLAIDVGQIDLNVGF